MTKSKAQKKEFLVGFILHLQCLHMRPQCTRQLPCGLRSQKQDKCKSFRFGANREWKASFYETPSPNRLPLLSFGRCAFGRRQGWSWGRQGTQHFRFLKYLDSEEPLLGKGENRRLQCGRKNIYGWMWTLLILDLPQENAFEWDFSWCKECCVPKSAQGQGQLSGKEQGQLTSKVSCIKNWVYIATLTMFARCWFSFLYKSVLCCYILRLDNWYQR